jgi:hypothetical protein
MNDFDKPGYIDLNVALIDKFFIESSPLLRYDNVLTIKGLFNINNLKIIDPHNKTNKSRILMTSFEKQELKDSLILTNKKIHLVFSRNRYLW